MEVSSKFHPILTLALWKDILILIECEGRWAGHSGEEKNIFSLPGIEP
jgi:hypothetical protein